MTFLFSRWKQYCFIGLFLIDNLNLVGDEDYLDKGRVKCI